MASALEVYKAQANNKMAAMRNNQSFGEVVQTGITSVVGAGIGYAEGKSSNTNIAPMAAVAGGTAALFTSGMARRGALALLNAGATISMYNLGKGYATKAA